MDDVIVVFTDGGALTLTAAAVVRLRALRLVGVPYWDDEMEEYRYPVYKETEGLVIDWLDENVPSWESYQ